MSRIRQILYTLSNQSCQDIPYVFNLIRLEVIARKALRDGDSYTLVNKKLMQDYYIQEIQKKLGKAMAVELISHIVQKAINKEQEVSTHEPKFT